MKLGRPALHKRKRAIVLALTLAATACSAPSEPTESQSTATASTAATATIAPKLTPGDISHTNLPDTNYASKELLEGRKQALASESAELAAPKKAGTIEPIAIDPYNRSDYPDVVRQWGKLIPTINRERKVVAKLVASDPHCDGVVNVQITDHGSRLNRHYMSECNNLTRIYFDGPSLAARKPALIRTQADMGAQGILDW